MQKPSEPNIMEVMSKKRNIYSAEFKSKIVMELISGQKTLNDLAEKYQIAPATLSSWNKQFQDRAAEIFRHGPTDNDRLLVEKEQEIAILQQKVGQLSVECDWLKKKSDEIFGPDGPHRTRFPRK